MTTMSFNGYRFDRKFKAFCDSRPLPEFVDASVKIDGANGESFESLTLGVREFSITLVALNKTAKSLQTLARELTGVLAVASPKPFMFGDEVDGDGKQLVRYAVPTGVFDSEDFVRAGRWTGQFKQHDPYLYGKSRSVVLKANQPQKINVGGNAETWPYAVAKPRGSRYTLSGNGSIVFDAPFSGNTLSIDFENQVARLSPNVANAAGLQTGSRFYPMRGTVTLTANAQTTLSWSERWL